MRAIFVRLLVDIEPGVRIWSSRAVVILPTLGLFFYKYKQRLDEAIDRKRKQIREDLARSLILPLLSLGSEGVDEPNPSPYARSLFGKKEPLIEPVLLSPSMPPKLNAKLHRLLSLVARDFIFSWAETLSPPDDPRIGDSIYNEMVRAVRILLTRR